MIVLRIVTASGLKEIISDQVIRWSFGKFFFPFGISKIICVDAYDFFSGIFKKIFQETLLIPIHVVERGNHKKIINEGFHRNFNKTQKIN